MNQITASALFVGVDAHQDFLAVAVLPEGAERSEPAHPLPNDPALIRRHFQRLQARDSVHATYEAGCTGFVLWRQLVELGVDCLVAAVTEPSGHLGSASPDYSRSRTPPCSACEIRKPGH